MWDPTPLNWSRLCGIGLANTGVRYVGRNSPDDRHEGGLSIHEKFDFFSSVRKVPLHNV